MLEITKLSKDFGQGKGIFDISLEIKPGHITGLLGPNGAGKSTLINCLTGLYYPTGGSFKLFNKLTNPLNIHQFLPKMGIMLSEIQELPNLTANQILNRYFQLRKDKLPPNLATNFDLKSEIQRLSDVFEIQTNKPFRQLSLGNKKKIAIVKTLAHKPDLVILDEPTSGLDPLIQKKLFAELKSVKDRGGLVFLSSHVLGEVQTICDFIIMVKNGKVISQNDTKELLEKSYNLVVLPIQFEEQIQSIKQDFKEFQIEQRENKLIIKTYNILPFLELANRHQIQDISITKPSLQELFLEKY